MALSSKVRDRALALHMDEQMRTTGTSVTPEHEELEEGGYVREAAAQLRSEKPTVEDLAKWALFQEIEELKQWRGKADPRLIHAYNRIFTLKGQLTRAKRSKDADLMRRLEELFEHLGPEWMSL